VYFTTDASVFLVELIGAAEHLYPEIGFSLKSATNADVSDHFGINSAKLFLL
jgi:hypothetical protein